jgi:hypothetical protein
MFLDCATVFRSQQGGPDVVYLHFDDLPCPTSTTKKGLSVEFKTPAGTAERYLTKTLEISGNKIEVRS